MPQVADRSGYNWQTSGRMKRLTLAGDTTLMPSAGVPGGLGWGAQYYVLDLSTSGARSGDVVLELDIPNPLDDYDLSVTTSWGWYGSQNPQGATQERVIIRDAPHCAILQVYGDNLYGISGQPPRLTAHVRKNASADGGGTGPSAPPAPKGGAGVVATTPNGASVGFVPLAVALPQGSTLTFVNGDSMTHDVTATDERRGEPLFSSPFTDGGAASEVAGVEDLKPGTYPFNCSLHTNMQGALTIF
jgi:plastocyanin